MGVAQVQTSVSMCTRNKEQFPGQLMIWPHKFTVPTVLPDQKSTKTTYYTMAELFFFLKMI